MTYEEYEEAKEKKQEHESFVKFMNRLFINYYRTCHDIKFCRSFQSDKEFDKYLFKKTGGTLRRCECLSCCQAYFDTEGDLCTDTDEDILWSEWYSLYKINNEFYIIREQSFKDCDFLLSQDLLLYKVERC